MTSPPAPGSPSRRWLHAAVAGGLLLTIAVLPALWVGANLSAPAGEGEAARLFAALPQAGDDGRGGVVRRAWLWWLGSVPEAATRSAESLLPYVPRVRLGQLGFLLACSGLVYLVTAAVRGRLQAMLACLCLLALPPLALEGHLLRPEVVATTFGLCALAGWMRLAAEGHRRRRSPVRRLVGIWLAVAGAGVAAGLEVAALPDRGALLLLPGALLMVGALQLGSRAFRLGQRRGWLRVPIHAVNRRLWPWTAAAMLTPVFGWWLLVTTSPPAAAAAHVTPSGVRLWPAAPAAAILVWAGLGLGFGVAAVRAGLGFGRRRRLSPELVWFAYLALQLLSALVDPADCDAFPAVPAAAMLLAEGGFVGLPLWLAWRRSARLTSPRRGSPP